MVSARPGDALLTATLLDHLLALPDHEALLARLLREEVPAARTDPRRFILANATIDTRQLAPLDASRGPAELVSLFLGLGSDCHGEPKSLFAIWSRDPRDGSLHLERSPSLPAGDGIHIVAATYEDGSRSPILIYQTRLGVGLLRAGANGYVPDPEARAETRELTPRDAGRHCSASD
jgi:hypothetical protein